VKPQRQLAPRTRSDLSVREAPDGLVVYDWRRDRIHHLNPTAALIFLLCNGQDDPTTIAERVGRAFQVPPLTRETEQCLASFQHERILERRYRVPRILAPAFKAWALGSSRLRPSYHHLFVDARLPGRPIRTFRRLLSAVFYQTRRALGADRSFSPRGPNPVPIDIFIPTVEKDLALLTHCVVNARRHILHPIGGIYIVAPGDSTAIRAMAQELDCQFVPEESVLPVPKENIDHRAGGRNLSGWLLQQLLKLSADTVCQNRYILILDSDTCFLGPRVFLHNDRPLFDLSAEYHESYFAMNQRLLGLRRRISRSFITHYMLFDSEVLERLRSDIERRWDRPWYRAILDCKDNEEMLCFSEYELYGDYYRRNGPKRPILNLWSNLGQRYISGDHVSLVLDPARATYRSISFHNLSIEEVFSEIYATGRWGTTEAFDSGGGSRDGFPDSYVKFVRDLIIEAGARRAVDIGCGNFRVAAGFVDILESYVGIDVVPELIERNAAEFSRPGVTFRVADATTADLPDGDICFVRQVFQHLSNAQIAAILQRCSKFPLVVITECWPAPSPFGQPNRDISHGHLTRVEFGSWVDVSKAPFGCAPIRECLVVPYYGWTIRTMIWTPTAARS
jgi:hypothetical protein